MMTSGKEKALLSWHDAEQIVGRRLDWHNHFDCCLYDDLLTKSIMENANKKEDT